MINVKADTAQEELLGEVTYHIDAKLTFDVDASSQFEDEAEAVIWNLIMFMAEHSELSEREILLSLLSDLDDDEEGRPPYAGVE